jgi:hypothetical protein
MNTTTSEMTDALKQTLTIRVPVVVRHEEEMDYDRFCEEYMSAEDDEDSPTLDKRCRETWEAMIALYEKDGYVELEEIDGGEEEGDVLNDYSEASDAFQDVVEDAVGDLKRRREYEAKREEREAAAKAAKQKMLEERKQKAKEAEEFAQWKKAKAEMPAPPPVKVEMPAPPTFNEELLVKAFKLALDRVRELEERVKELTEGV